MKLRPGKSLECEPLAVAGLSKCLELENVTV